MKNTRKGLAKIFGVTAAALTCAVSMPVIQAAEADIDPRAVEVLQTSLDYVSSLKEFAVDTHSTIEIVMESGQKLQFDNDVDTTVQRPNKLHSVRKGEVVDQEFFYNGKTLTLHDSMAGFHATVEVPGTLEGMLDFARDSLDIVAPAGDFIYSNALELMMDGVESAMYIGPSFVEGQICDHLAFSAPGHSTDWQIWVQRGETPLPRRIVITSRDVLNAPQFTVHIKDWDLSPNISADDFDFRAHASSTEIEFLKLGEGQ